MVTDQGLNTPSDKSKLVKERGEKSRRELHSLYTKGAAWELGSVRFQHPNANLTAASCSWANTHVLEPALFTLPQHPHCTQTASPAAVEQQMPPNGIWRPKAAAVNKYLAYFSNAVLKHNLRKYHKNDMHFPYNTVLSPGQEVRLISSLCLLKLGDKVEIQL